MTKKGDAVKTERCVVVAGGESVAVMFPEQTTFSNMLRRKGRINKNRSRCILCVRDRRWSKKREEKKIYFFFFAKHGPVRNIFPRCTKEERKKVLVLLHVGLRV